MQKYQDKGKLKQWICTITANLCKDYFRSKAYKSSSKEVSSEICLQNAAVQSAPEERIERKRRAKIVLKAVDDLPKIYREIIVLSEFEGFSIEEIAKRLKIPQGTVKSRHHKAKELLRITLTQLLGENL